jgi:hypothetical protein
MRPGPGLVSKTEKAALGRLSIKKRNPRYLFYLSRAHLACATGGAPRVRGGRRARGANEAANGRALLTAETSELKRCGGGGAVVAVLGEVRALQVDCRRRRAAAAAKHTSASGDANAAANGRALLTAETSELKRCGGSGGAVVAGRAVVVARAREGGDPRNAAAERRHAAAAERAAARGGGDVTRRGRQYQVETRGDASNDRRMGGRFFFVSQEKNIGIPSCFAGIL